MQVPVVPDPPLRAAPARVIARWPEGFFLENLVFAPDGSLIVTAFLQQQLFRVDVATGEFTSLCRTDFFPLGIANDGAGGFIVSGQRQPGFEPRAAEAQDGFWQVTASGRITHLADAVGARFLNGLTPLGDGRFACADSSGALWLVEPKRNRAVRTSTCVQLSPHDAAAPLPAANGVKLRDGYLYVSNWVRATVVRAPLQDLSRFELVHEAVVIDDFAFSSDGAIFGASHMQTVVCIEPNGERFTVGGVSEQVHGATACAFGPDGALYVITDGASVAFQLGLAPSLEPARLVRLDVQRSGHPVG